MPEFDSPQSRNEAILQNILGADNELLPPESRIETLLQQLLASLGGSGDSKEFEIGIITPTFQAYPKSIFTV